jgi:hypothetical protein
MRCRITAALAISFSLGFSQQAGAQFLPRGFDNNVHDIRQGGQFGVQIGMDRATARRILERHWNIHFSFSYKCQHELFYDKDCNGSEFQDNFDVAGSLLGANIELYVRDDKIVEMTWWENPIDP